MTSISPKVTAATLASALVAAVCWALDAMVGVEVPVEVQAALVVIATFAAGYLTTDPQRV
jgi:phage-related protein